MLRRFAAAQPGGQRCSSTVPRPIRKPPKSVGSVPPGTLKHSTLISVSRCDDARSNVKDNLQEKLGGFARFWDVWGWILSPSSGIGRTPIRCGLSMSAQPTYPIDAEPSDHLEQYIATGPLGTRLRCPRERVFRRHSTSGNPVGAPSCMRTDFPCRRIISKRRPSRSSDSPGLSSVPADHPIITLDAPKPRRPRYRQST